MQGEEPGQFTEEVKETDRRDTTSGIAGIAARILED